MSTVNNPIFGNESAVEMLKKFIDSTIQKKSGPQFFLLIGPSGIGKFSHAKKMIQEYLGDFAYSDALFLQDYSSEIGKTHTIPVETPDKPNHEIQLADDERIPNYGIREVNARLQQSSFSLRKFVLIENMQRMSNTAMNAFLKTAEEPLSNRFIIATTTHSSQVMDTILSRSVQIVFEPLTFEQMEVFADQNQLFMSLDEKSKKSLIAMSMGKPGMLMTLGKSTESKPEIIDAIQILWNNIENVSFSKVQAQRSLKLLSDEGILSEFIDGLISYLTENDNYQLAKHWMKVKKLMGANINVENILWYGVIQS
ncbi:hypothetical protein AGMMS50249_6430 [candidate division SR1 bacterium]|nr:hypothetical protein AGMMS50249_6430 [candidate division SR1 bacterium]